MTEDPLARLRDELVGAADRLNTAGAPAPAGGRRRRRGGWIALVAVLIGAPAGAAAAGIIEFGESTDSQARVIVVDVLRDTTRLPACTRPHRTKNVLTDTALLPGITAALPALRRPATGIDPGRVLRRLRVSLAGGPILRQSVRRFLMPGNVELISYVQEGEGLGAVSDPVRCDRTRRERAALLAADRSEPVRRAVARQLADLFEGAARAQGFRIFVQSPPRTPFAGTGAGSSVRPGRRLRSGLLSSGSAGGGGRMYAGIARPRTAAVLLRAQRPGQAKRIPDRIAVRDGFYAFVIPRGTGPVSLTEVTATGSVVRVLPVRR